MKVMERIAARHDAKARGATIAEAIAAVRAMEADGTALPVAPVELIVEEVEEVVEVEEVAEPVSTVTDDGVVVAGEETRAQTIADTTASEFEDMTVAELRDIASEFEIEGRSSMDKAELVAALEAL